MTEHSRPPSSGAGRSQQGGGRSGEHEYEQQHGGNGEQHDFHFHSRHHAMSLPVIAMRGMGRIYDLQMAATRLMLETQANTAVAFGWPDYSGLFRVADERVRRVFSSGTEQLLQLAEQANETTSEVQRQVGQMLETQAISEAEHWQRGLEELGQQAEQSLEEFREMTRQQLEETIRATESLSEQGREAMRESGDQIRQSMQESMRGARERMSSQEDPSQADEDEGETRQAGRSPGDSNGGQTHARAASQQAQPRQQQAERSSAPSGGAARRKSS